MQILTELAVAIADNINKLYGTTLSSDAITASGDSKRISWRLYLRCLPNSQSKPQKPLDTTRVGRERYLTKLPLREELWGGEWLLNLELADDQLLAHY